MRLDRNDIQEIRLRLVAREVAAEDVAALLDEVDELHGDLRLVGLLVDEPAHAEPWEVASAVKERLEVVREQADRIREYEAFERGCGAVLSAVASNSQVDHLLLRSVRLANPGEYCSMCCPEHADECGFCERHGKKVRGLWVDTDGPTQTGLISLVAFGLLLLELLARIAREGAEGAADLTRRRAIAAAALGAKTKPYLLDRLRAAGVALEASATKQVLAQRIAELEVK